MKRPNGKKYFYQWELNQQLIVLCNCDEVHYENGTQKKAHCCEVKEDNGQRVVDVPNDLLQTAAPIHAYAWDKENGCIVAYCVFDVEERSKPADYLYTQTEIKSFDLLVEDLKENLAGLEEALRRANEVYEAFESGELKGEQGVQGEPGPQGEKGDKGDKGDPQDAVCYTKQDLTDEQKEQARKNIGAVDPEVFRLVSEETSENWNDIQSMRTEMTEMVSTYTQRFDEKQKAQARENIGATTIDDSSIGSDTWSSKNTVDRLCPDIAESGAVVTCEPVGGYPLYVVTQLPTDRRTGLTLRRFGENLLNHTATDQTITGVTFTVGDDGSITANGTATADVFLTLGKVQLTKGKNYILAGCPDGGSYSSKYTIYTTNNSKYYYDVGDGVAITAEATQNNTFRIMIKSGCTVSNLVFRPILYEANTGKTYSVKFGQTVNGGSYDWNSGILTDENGEETQLTAQTINALDGVNTLWTDVGDMFVLGKANPVAVINKLTNAILALGGNV